MTRHTLSHADQLFHGNGAHAGHENGLRGLPFTPIAQIDFGAPIAALATRIRAAAAVGAAGALVLGGTLTLDGTYGRNVTIVSSGAGDTTQIVTVRGYDYLGNKVTEELTANGVASVVGDKAFAVIESAEASAAFAGNLSIGVGVKLGLPFVVRGTFDVLESYVDSAKDAGTIVAADATAATATTGDVRGTYTPASAADGAKQFRAFIRSPGGPAQADVFGVTQYADF